MELLLGYHSWVVSATFCFLFCLLLHNFSVSRTKSKSLPTNWLLVGMLPSLVVNHRRIYDWMTHYLSKNGCTCVGKGPWFTSMDTVIVTSDPANMRHIFYTNFSNYLKGKGSDFNESFDFLGDSMFNADGESSRTQRKELHQLFIEKQFQHFYQQSCRSKVEKELVPVLEHVVDLNMVVDLQDLFKRFMFDATIMFFSGIDPASLGVGFERNPYVDALQDIEEAIAYRHLMPACCWKLQRWLGIGREKKLREGKDCLDEFAAHCIATKRENIQAKKLKNEEREGDLMTSFLEGHGFLGEKSDTAIRDSMLTFILAGTGTVAVGLTWFFSLVLQNPGVETAIIEELKNKISTSIENEDDNKLKIFDAEELKGLVYLHAAFCEALRLFPPVPLEMRKPIQDDTLPSGHRVDSGTEIVVSIYGMGRMEEVWGKDCLEFKPERWISEEGGIKHVPSHKFMSFLTGPRSCVGKEIAFTQMKMVAATLLYNFHVELVESNSITMKTSLILYMVSGMMVRIKRRP